MSEDECYEQLRPLLFSIAYRMLGSVSDAEDVVQEAWLRLERAQREGTIVASRKAFLTTVTTRLAIDQLRSARAQRETYFGLWLPEPLITATARPPGCRRGRRLDDDAGSRVIARTSWPCSSSTSTSSPSLRVAPVTRTVLLMGMNRLPFEV